MRYSWSRRCIAKGTQARPDSIQIVFSPGNRSGMPLTIQLVRCVRLHVTNDIECTERNRFMVEVMVSPQVGPAWNPMGSPRRSSSAYTFM